MRSISAQLALLGPDLQPEGPVSIQLDTNNRILDISQTSTSSTRVIVPAFFNAHVHAADIGIRNEVGRDLHKAVGPGGIKHQYLQSLSTNQTRQNITQAITEAKSNGILGYADFREGGVAGLEPYAGRESTFIPFARPRKDELDNLPAGMNLGIRDVVAYDSNTMIDLVQKVKTGGGRSQIHVSEDKDLRSKWQDQYGMTDIVWAVDKVGVDTLVHATLASQSDIDHIGTTNTSVVVCPTSNHYFQVGKPPVDDFLSAEVPLGLGSDNAMVNPLALWQEFEFLTRWEIPTRTQLIMATVGGAQTAGLDWGIAKGNSQLLILDFNKHIDPPTLYERMTSPKILNYLVESIPPVTSQSHN